MTGLPGCANTAFTVSVLVNELVNVSCVNEIEIELHVAKNIMQEWRQKYLDLEKDKVSLLEQLHFVVNQKGEELENLTQDLTCYIRKIENMEQLIPNSHRPLGKLGERHRLRGKAGVALWFLESYGLKLSCLKAKEHDTGKPISFN